MKRSLNIVRRITFLIVPALLFLSAVLLISCDVSARWDLKRAERALNDADKANAEFWCEREYRKAQKYFDRAMDLARARKINEARDMALEAMEWAEEAMYTAIRKAEEMEKERAGIDSKKF